MATGRGKGGPIGYDFAPTRRSQQQQTRSQGELSSAPSASLTLSEPPHSCPAPSRLTLSVDVWCSCFHCQTMPKEVENICCQEINFSNIEDKVPCIAHHNEFKKICLSTSVLEVAIVMQRHVQGFRGAGELSNKSYRFTAYRAFTAWTHGYLGKGKRQVIPACAVSRIRAKFPADDDTYTGFHGSSEIGDALCL